MTIPCTGLSSSIIDKVAAMLAACTTFQTMVGATTGDDAARIAAARLKIIEIDDTPPVGAHAAIDRPDIGDMSRASSTHILGSASIDMIITWPPTSGLTATESWRDASNTDGALLAELWDEADELIQTIVPDPIVQADESDPLPDWFQARFTITMICMP